LPSSRPKFAQVSEAMKEWSALMGAELSSLPAVTSRRMFGMTAFFRKGVIFAALPRTRSFATPHSVAFKLYRKAPRVLRMLQNDGRIGDAFDASSKWITFELSGAKDLGDALKWLDLAYRTCLSSQNPKS
jgi:hypothetical protein